MKPIFYSLSELNEFKPFKETDEYIHSEKNLDYDVLFSNLFQTAIQLNTSNKSNPLIKHYTKEELHGYFLHCLFSTLHTIDNHFHPVNGSLTNLTDIFLYEYSETMINQTPSSVISKNTFEAKNCEYPPLFICKFSVEDKATYGNITSLRNKTHNLFVNYPFLLKAVDVYIVVDNTITGPIKSLEKLTSYLSTRKSNIYIPISDLNWLETLVLNIENQFEFNKIFSWYNKKNHGISSITKFLAFEKNLVHRYDFPKSRNDLLNSYQWNELFKINYITHLTSQLLQFLDQLTLLPKSQQDTLTTEMCETIANFMELAQYIYPGHDSVKLFNSEEEKWSSAIILAHQTFPASIDEAFKYRRNVTREHIAEMNQLIHSVEQNFFYTLIRMSTNDLFNISDQVLCSLLSNYKKFLPTTCINVSSYSALESDILTHSLQSVSSQFNSIRSTHSFIGPYKSKLSINWALGDNSFFKGPNPESINYRIINPFCADTTLLFSGLSSIVGVLSNTSQRKLNNLLHTIYNLHFNSI